MYVRRVLKHLKRVSTERRHEKRIKNEWFRSHFVYAGDRIVRTLGRHIDLDRSTILDFGCGDGIITLAVALKSKARVLGVDIHDAMTRVQDAAQAQIGLASLPSNLQFKVIEPGRPIALPEKVDAIYSWSVFEHVDRRYLDDILSNFYELLKPKGLVFLQIAPLYYAPFGSHLEGLIKEPWAHLLYPQEVFKQRLYEGESSGIAVHNRDLAYEVHGDRGFKDFMWREYNNLNKLTASEILHIFASHRLLPQEVSFGVMNDMNVPESIAGEFTIQDLLTNEIACVFKKY